MQRERSRETTVKGRWLIMREHIHIFLQVKQIVTDSYKILHFDNINTEYINIQVIQPYTAKKIRCSLKNRVPNVKYLAVPSQSLLNRRMMCRTKRTLAVSFRKANSFSLFR